MEPPVRASHALRALFIAVATLVDSPFVKHGITTQVNAGVPGLGPHAGEIFAQQPERAEQQHP
jgi:hypothetical protein